MFVYTAYKTTAATGDTVLKSYNLNHEQQISGEIGMALNFAGTTVMAVLLPGVLIIISRKTAIIIGAVLSLTMTASYIYPTVATIYLFSFISGIGGAFLWVGQGAELLANSDSSNIDYHSALFWLMYQVSTFSGNLYVFFAWKGRDFIDNILRIELYSILVGFGSLGLVAFALIKNIPAPVEITEEQDVEDLIAIDGDDGDVTDETEAVAEIKQTNSKKFLDSLKTVVQAVKYCGSTHFLLIMIITMCIGLQLAFTQTIFPTCVGATKVMTDSTRLVGLMACLTGAGEIIGSFVSGALSKSETFKRGPVVVLGIILEFIAFGISVSMLPNESTMHNTYSRPMVWPSEIALCISSVFLGMGDAMLNSQVLNYIHSVTKSERERDAAFMMFNFVQSGVATIIFAVSHLLTLQVQLLVISLFMVAGLICFLKLDIDIRCTNKYNHED